MKWLVKPRFTWADFLFLLVASQLPTIPFWGYFILGFIWSIVSIRLVDANYHEALPRV